MAPHRVSGNRRPHVTLKDIAAHCGVSVGTVSFALRRDPRFSKATVERICAVAEELGYDPTANHAARRLVMLSHGQKVLNYLTAMVLPAHFYQINYYLKIFQGAAEVFTRERFGMLPVNVYNATDAEGAEVSLPLAVTRGDVDGLVAFGDPSVADPLLQQLDAHYDLAELPLVFYMQDVPGHPSVVTDDEQGAREAARYLLELGHRHIMLLSDADLTLPSRQRRGRGIERALNEAGLDLKTHFHVFRESLGPALAPHHLDPLADVAADTEAIHAHPLAQYLEAHPEVTGIITRNDITALRAWYLLSLLGRRVPQDYSLISFDDTDPVVDEQGQSLLTAVRLPLEEVGRTAAELLVRRIKGETVPALTMLPTELVVRRSTGLAR